MATYIILSIIVLFVVWLAIGRPLKKPSKPWLLLIGVLIILTAVFDNVIVGLKIVGYDTDKIIGLYVGMAPVEDFMYAILAAVLIPVVWNKLGASRAK